MDFLSITLLAFCLLFAAGITFLFRELLKAKSLASQSESLLAERNELREKLSEADKARIEAEKQVALVEQRLTEQKARMEDWETQRQESVKTAKAAILEAGAQMSSKLLEDHKREQEAAKKEQEERVQKATASLLEQVSTLGKSVASLKDNNETTSKQMQTVWRALTSPSSAGQLAEFGLENALKNLGLEVGRDFIMQYAISGHGGEGRLRPDAVVFLPQDMVLVIDCKASKFLMELAEVEGTDEEAAMRDKLVASMQKHVKDLASKDYASAVQEALKQQHGSSAKMGQMLNVMYLPNESAWEKLREFDSEMQNKLEKANLIPASPTTLMGLFSLATLKIAEARRMNQQDEINEAASQLIESVSTMVGHMDSMGRAISSAMTSFDKATKSANSRVLPRMKKLVGMGIKPAKNKPLPKPVISYDVKRLDDMRMIDGEAEEWSPEDESSDTKQLESLNE